MKMILAHWKKDLLSSRGLVITWAACVILMLLMLAFRFAAPHLMPMVETNALKGTPKGVAFFLIGMLGFVCSAGLQFALLSLLLARVVHLDPLIDPNAWWRTRPIAPLNLLAVKGFTAGLGLLGAFLTIAVIKFGDISMLATFLSATIFVLGVIAFASVSRNLSQLILNWLGLGLVAGYLAQVIRVFFDHSVSLARDHSFSLGMMTNFQVPQAVASQAIWLGLLYLAGFLAAIFCQYLTRRTNLSRVILFATFFVAMLLEIKPR